MKSKTITAISLAIGLALGGACHKSKGAPEEFRTVVDHHNSARKIADHYHGGLRGFAEDKDFDRDGKCDMYMICSDGTIYARHSSDLISTPLSTAKDKVNERTWYRTDKKTFKEANEECNGYVLLRNVLKKVSK